MYLVIVDGCNKQVSAIKLRKEEARFIIMAFGEIGTVPLDGTRAGNFTSGFVVTKLTL